MPEHLCPIPDCFEKTKKKSLCIKHKNEYSFLYPYVKELRQSSGLSHKEFWQHHHEHFSKCDSEESVYHSVQKILFSGIREPVFSNLKRELMSTINGYGSTPSRVASRVKSVPNLVDFPEEVLVRICKFLPAKDIQKMYKCTKIFGNISYWRHLLPLTVNENTNYRLYALRNNFHCPHRVHLETRIRVCIKCLFSKDYLTISKTTARKLLRFNDQQLKNVESFVCANTSFASIEHYMIRYRVVDLLGIASTKHYQTIKVDPIQVQQELIDIFDDEKYYVPCVIDTIEKVNDMELKSAMDIIEKALVSYETRKKQMMLKYPNEMDTFMVRWYLDHGANCTLNHFNHYMHLRKDRLFKAGLYSLNCTYIITETDFGRTVDKTRTKLTI